MIELHREILDEPRLETWKMLEQFKGVAVLGGGTALALQIGHRKSYDFDLMVSEPIKSNLWSKVVRVFGKYTIKTPDNEDQLNFVTKDNIAVTFLYNEYSFLFDAIGTESISLMDVRDIAGDKAMTVGRRGKWHILRTFLITRSSMREKRLKPWG